MTRYALYYRLIDLAMISQIIAWGDVLAQKAFHVANLESTLPKAAYHIAMITLLITAFALPSLLVFQRWMRDEFSEAIWQKTAGTVLKLIVVLPYPIMILTVEWILAGPPFSPLDGTYGKGAETDRAIDTIINCIQLVWMLTPVLFVFAFQWHRWRASR